MHLAICPDSHEIVMSELTESHITDAKGGGFCSRELRRQRAELYTKSIALNKMTKLGMPLGDWLAT